MSDRSNYLVARIAQDIPDILARREAPLPPEPTATGIRAVAAVERSLLCRGRLFPGGITPSWSGVDLEAHGLPAGPTSTLSFALRWHGANAALLWEVDGPGVALSAPALDPTWASTAPAGESLLRLG